MQRRLSDALVLAVTAAGTLMLAGCAGAVIHNVSAPEPSKCGKVVVDCEVTGLYPHPCVVVANWAGYEVMAPVPLQGGPQPEYVSVELRDWRYVSKGDLNRMDLRFEYKGKIIARKKLPPLFNSPEVLTKPCGDEAPAAPAATGGGSATTTPGKPAAGGPKDMGQPAGWPVPQQYSTSLDAPTKKPLSDEIVCQLDAGSGPRYVALEHTPNGVVKLTIDVASKGEARFREVTFWSIELLDEEGQPLPLAEEGRVDLGGHRRVNAEWRFDGSPVVLKLQSFSQAGDWMRIRFE
jgi:hypothetical protein